MQAQSQFGEVFLREHYFCFTHAFSFLQIFIFSFLYDWVVIEANRVLALRPEKKVIPNLNSGQFIVAIWTES